MQWHPHALGADLILFASVLSSVPREYRKATASEIIAECYRREGRHGADLTSVLTERLQPARADLRTHEGIDCYEIALNALRGVVRNIETQGEAA